MAKNYYLKKKTKDNNISATISKEIKGFVVKPKNEIEYDGVKVDYMMVVKPSMIKTVLKKKIRKKLDAYLNYIISLIDTDDDVDGEKLEQAINDLEHYKSIIRYKYKKYLEEKYVTLLLNKVSLIEKELRIKQETLMNIKEIESESKGKGK